MRKSIFGLIIAGLCAGLVNGLFGAGGGMVLIPLLTLCTQLNESEIFPASVSIILPICLVSIYFTVSEKPLSFQDLFPYLCGSAIGGIVSGLTGKKIPTNWMHKALGLLITWGGIRYLC